MSTITLYEPDGSDVSTMLIPSFASQDAVDRIWEGAADLADARGLCAIYRRGDSQRPAMARGTRRLTSEGRALAIPTDPVEWLPADMANV